jgi:hypothetical protein
MSLLVFVFTFCICEVSCFTPSWWELQFVVKWVKLAQDRVKLWAYRVTVINLYIQ